MTRIIFTLIIFSSLSSFAQRSLIYPIVLVHGWTGSSETWKEFVNHLENNVGLSIERNSLSYNLNCDYNHYSSNKYTDVCDSNYGIIQDKDVYIISFDTDIYSIYDNKSNQAAAVKQGYALKFAVKKVLNATGADKVILVGHSMGGLAIREYLQNSENWQNDGTHHISKVLTIGTPHGGSNFSGSNLGLFFGYDENSEAVRDLRESYVYSSCTRAGQKISCPGVYLFGGQETKSWMITNIYGGSGFYNTDVNCNGTTGEQITGLNQKSIRSDLDFSCIIGGPNNNDVIVSTYSQNLNNFYGGINAELFYYNCNGDVVCHTNEPKKAFQELLQGLDEPKKTPNYVSLGKWYKGIFTTQSSGSNVDNDDYFVQFPEKGVVTIAANNYKPSNAYISIKSPTNTTIYNQIIGNGIYEQVRIETGGYYKATLTGNSLGAANTYNFSFGFCSLPNDPIIIGEKEIEFCEGGKFELQTPLGFDEYTWLKNGNVISGINSNKLEVKESGYYTVEGKKCGVKISSILGANVIVKPNPQKPNVNIIEYHDKYELVSTSEKGNSWFYEGRKIENMENKILEPQNLGYYSVTVTENGCATESEKVLIEIKKPELEIIGNKTMCNGDSLIINCPKNFGAYKLFRNDSLVKTSSINFFSVNKTGIYKVMVERGIFKSPFTDTLNILVKDNPLKPDLALTNEGLVSSFVGINFWQVNGTLILDFNGNILKYNNPGIYAVKAYLNGCLSDPGIFTITSMEVKEQSFMKILPNPSDGNFVIQFSENINDPEIEIINSQGKIVLKYSKNGLFKSLSINASITSGLYTARVKSLNKVKICKVLIY